MPDHQANPATGEIIDVDALSDRGLLEAVFRQNQDIQHQNIEILAALADQLKAEHVTQGIVSDVLKAAKGEHKQDGKSMKDELHEFQNNLRALVGAVERVPAQTGDIVDGRLEATLLRVVGDSAPIQ